MTVKELAKSNPQGLIGKAYFFSEKAHGGQKRESGEPYFNHALATAEILNRWSLDEQTIAAGLLHDTVEDKNIPLENIKKDFGEDVAFLVDGVTKLGRISAKGARLPVGQGSPPDGRAGASGGKDRGAQEKIENMRKMILALSRDLRVVFIKLADRLHNMRTLGALPPAKQKRIAMETDEIYAPLAYRLGMQNLSGELQDLSFPCLHPEENKWLNQFISNYETRRKYLEKIKPVVEKMLLEQNIKPIMIDFRAKRRSSLYKKLIRHEMDIEKIYDLVAVRIIVESVKDCYAALGIIHEHWPPLPGRIKDYIAMPKPNGYRSLHTTIIGPDDKKVEFQIRTKEMHEENEGGIAAHWLYEQKKRGESIQPQKLTEAIAWVQQLRNWQEKFFGVRQLTEKNKDEILQAMKIDFFMDRIYAITPRGDVVDLPAGATPVDFAYSIHTAIGNSCAGAKVNDSLVTLDYELKSGDVVEILTQKNKKPSEDWLKFVKTSIARDRIKSAIRGKERSLIGGKPKAAELKIVAEDRIGVIKDISAAISRSHINILNFETSSQPGTKFVVNKAEIAITDKRKIEKLILKLKNIKGLKEIGYKLV